MPRQNQRILDLEEGILNSVELLDNCDGSRLNLVNTLDEVRETLVECYGETFQGEYDEMLGIEPEISDDEDEIIEGETE
jgi:hypothetical protein